MHKVEDIRNLAILGAGHTGKTALLDAIAFATKVSARHGKSTDGTSVSDSEPEEKERDHTLTSHLFHFPRGNRVFHMIDTAGHADFIADSVGSLRAVETAILVVDAGSGVTFNTRRLWSEAERAGIARMIVLTKSDHENIDLDAVLTDIRNSFGDKVVPITFANGSGSACTGLINIRTDAGDQVDEWRALLDERVAESDDALMERFFESGLNPDDLKKHLPTAMAKGTIVPLLAVNPPSMLGIDPLLDFIGDYCPSPKNAPPRPAAATADATEFPIEIQADPDGAFCGLVFKIVSDPFVGKMSHIRILRGTLPADGTFTIVRSGEKVKLHGLLQMQGADTVNIETAVPGDLVAVAKVEHLELGDTVTADGDQVHLRPFHYPTPMVAVAIEPKSRNDEQKIGPSLEKLAAEDPTLHVGRDVNTGELVVEGLSQLHLDVVFAKLKRRYKVEVTTHEPSVPYRETIMAGSEGHHRHKKQSGGKGQFAEVYLRAKARERGEGFEFLDKVVGGRIPRQFIPEVEKGVASQMKAGPLSGCPIVDVQVELYDGKFHDVDSDALSFQLAGGRAFLDAFEKSKPIILEPMMKLAIRVPSRFVGDISSNLSSQRARMTGMDAEGDDQIVNCIMPMKEARGYQTQLRSITAGEGSFTMEYSHYDPVPANIQQEIMAAKAHEKEAHGHGH
ncbi:MAG: elongation factor G [Planctomycetes bacterium]|nr:elongation factor G [Planctomycetota bacterium]